MKNIYPNQLIQRPATEALRKKDIQIGDVVVLHPSDSTTTVASTVIMVVPLHGSTTYTSESLHAPASRGQPPLLTRYRFRLQDVHGIAAA